MTNFNAGNFDKTKLGRETRLDQEAGLVQRACQGESEALEKLYENYVDPIYAYIWRRVGNKADAEALTSDVFMRAIEGLLQGRYTWQGKPFGAWLFRIASNLCKEWSRDHGKQSSITLDDLDDKQLLKEDKEDILDTLLAQEKLDKLWQLVAELPLVEQRILVFRYMYGYSYNEIAKRLDRTEAACKQLHYRALQRLKARVQDLEP